MVAAVPDYVGKSFAEAPPGHRFRLYFDGWEVGGGPITVDKSLQTLGRCGAFPASSSATAEGLRERQLLACNPADLVKDAEATSAFVTGMGLEHPIENGFAFLDPYGLPYLPGSSVKGVLRRAAEELALFGDPREDDWTISDVWWLFGVDGASAYWRPAPRAEKDTPEAQAARGLWREAYRKAVERLSDAALRELDPIFEAIGEPWLVDRRGTLLGLPDEPKQVAKLHNRGALQVWDAIPLPPAKRMEVDVMTPHFPGYYQDGKLPTDNQDPVPIYFLTLPAGTKMRFVVACHPTGLEPARVVRSARWKELAASGLEHAFAWLGFGAKTTAGYGRFTVDKRLEQERQREVERAAEAGRKRREEEAARQAAEMLEQRRAGMSPVERDVEDALAAAREGNEARVTELFKKLEQAQGEERLAYAVGLREAFTLLGKWTGKQSPKQTKKNEAVLRVLREGGKA